MSVVKTPQQCCGCSACYSVCPRNAISMKPDPLGFLYPNVDKLKCVECGLCEKICAFHENYDKSKLLKEPLAFGARHNKLEQVESSRSGAAFIAVSDWVLGQGGSVYGAGYEKHFRVIHKRAVTKQERDELKGSKYVQSDVAETFKMVKRDLQNGLWVLFSGTACQVAGLNSFIAESLKRKLILLDIVCHGAPSPYIWRDYIEYTEKKHGGTISAVNFRDKKNFGWKDHRESFVISGNYVSSTCYTYLFYQHVMFRHSCSVCYYTNLKRPGDISLADFWGWEKTNPGFASDDKGCSLVFCNTEKGLRIFNACKDCLSIFPVKLEDCMQHNLQRPSFISKYRKKFEVDYQRYGLEYLMYHYGNLGWRYKVRPYFRKMIQLVKRVLRK